MDPSPYRRLASRLKPGTFILNIEEFCDFVAQIYSDAILEPFLWGLGFLDFEARTFAVLFT